MFVVLFRITNPTKSDLEDVFTVDLTGISDLEAVNQLRWELDVALDFRMLLSPENGIHAESPW